MVEEHAVHCLAHPVVAAQGKADVAYPRARAGVGACALDFAHGVYEVYRVGIVLRHARRDGQDVCVENYVARVEARLFDEQFVRALADGNSVGKRRSLPAFVERHHDCRRAEFHNLPRVRKEFFLALFQAYRVDDALALRAFQASQNRLPIRRVYHQRNAGDFGFGADEVEEFRHARGRVEHAFVEVDVYEVCAVFDLIWRHCERVGKPPLPDHFAERGRAHHVCALADENERRVPVGNAQKLQARKRERVGRFGLARRKFGARRNDRLYVLGRRAAAAADHVQKPVGAVFAEVFCGVRGHLVVAEFRKRVRQPRVGVAVRVALGDSVESLDVRTHFLRAQSAVQAHEKRLRVPYRRVERIYCLSAQNAPRQVGDRHADGYRNFLAALFAEAQIGVDCRLYVQRVYRRFEYEQVRARLSQDRHLLVVRRAEFVESYRTRRRVGHVGGNACRLVHRADRPRHEQRLSSELRRDFVRRRPRRPHSRGVHVAHQVRAYSVFRLHYGVRPEGVCCGYIRPRQIIFPVNVGYYVGAGNREQIVVAAQFAGDFFETRVAPAEVRLGQTAPLNERAHAAVEKHNSFPDCFGKQRAPFGKR